MRHEVNVIVGGQDFSFSLEGQPPMDNAAARAWLDQQFVALQCEPLRPSGKLLLADKVVVIAREGGVAHFSDAQWGMAFAQAACAALGKQLLHVDADSLSVTY